jgi:hypothetical protein
MIIGWINKSNGRDMGQRREGHTRIEEWKKRGDETILMCRRRWKEGGKEQVMGWESNKGERGDGDKDVMC